MTNPEDLRRFKLIPLDQLTPAQKEVVDSIRSGARAAVASSAAGGQGPIGSPFNVLLRSPGIGMLVQKLGEQIRFHSSIPKHLNEMAIIITARHWDAQYEWHAHHRLALEAGLDPAVGEAIRLGQRPANMDADTTIVYDFSHELHTTKGVSDATYKAVIDRFGEQGAMDLIAVNGFYSMVSMILNVDRTPIPGGGKPPLPPLA